MIGTEVQVRLEKGRTFALTARIGVERVFVRETDPVVAHAHPGEVWRAMVIERHGSALWRIDLLERLSHAEPPPPVFDAEAFRAQAIPIAERHVGNATPEHLATALRTVPELIELGFYWEDRKGPFGIFQGIVIRPTYADRDHDRYAHVEVGAVYLVTVKSSGSRGLYATVLTCIERPCGDSNERVPDQFEVDFCEQDEWGIYGVFGSFKVRPDRNWPSRLLLGTKLKVWTVTVLRRSCNLVFVLPIGCTMGSIHGPTANGSR